MYLSGFLTRYYRTFHKHARQADVENSLNHKNNYVYYRHSPIRLGIQLAADPGLPVSILLLLLYIQK